MNYTIDPCNYSPLILLFFLSFLPSSCIHCLFVPLFRDRQRVKKKKKSISMVKVIVDTNKPRAARLWQKSTFPCKTRFCKDCASNIFFCFAISLLNNLLAFYLRIEIVPFPCKPMFVGYYLLLSLSYFLFYILIDTIWKENLLLYLLVLLSFHVLEKYTVKYAIRTFSRCSRSAIYRLIIESIFIPRKFESYDISSSIFFFF